MSWLKYSSAAPFDPLAEKRPPLENEGGRGGERGGKRGEQGDSDNMHTHTQILPGQKTLLKAQLTFTSG